MCHIFSAGTCWLVTSPMVALPSSELEIPGARRDSGHGRDSRFTTTVSALSVAGQCLPVGQRRPGRAPLAMPRPFTGVSSPTMRASPPSDSFDDGSAGAGSAWASPLVSGAASGVVSTAGVRGAFGRRLLRARTTGAGSDAQTLDLGLGPGLGLVLVETTVRVGGVVRFRAGRHLIRVDVRRAARPSARPRSVTPSWPAPSSPPGGARPRRDRDP